MLKDGLKMAPQQLIWPWSRQVIVVADCILEFFSGKWRPKEW